MLSAQPKCASQQHRKSWRSSFLFLLFLNENLSKITIEGNPMEKVVNTLGDERLIKRK
jgi:hypothetical protein